MHFYSRSRQELWHKGETSGSFLRVSSGQIDCDGAVLLFKVRADGPACHTGARSCFFRKVPSPRTYAQVESGPGILSKLFQVIQQRQRERPEGSYTTSLFERGTSRIAQKVAGGGLGGSVGRGDQGRGEPSGGSGGSAVPHAGAAGGRRHITGGGMGGAAPAPRVGSATSVAQPSLNATFRLNSVKHASECNRSCTMAGECYFCGD